MADVQPPKQALGAPKAPLTLVGALAIAALAVSIGWIERAVILKDLATSWVSSDELGHADAIAVLGGNVDVRAFAAAALYQRGLADVILVSNIRRGKAERLGYIPSQTKQIRDVLLRLGVPATAIVTFGEDLSSIHEEARAIRAWAAESHAKSVIVPAELFSARRVRWMFDHELAPIGVRVIVHAYQPQDYTLNNWWRHRYGLIDFNNEVLKYIYYRLRY
jgi:uncharacterized SAM-binding protein YcdF (DUF218 family)